MKPQYCPFLKCFPINFQLGVDKCFVVVIKNHLLTAGRGCWRRFCHAHFSLRVKNLAMEVGKFYCVIVYETYSTWKPKLSIKEPYFIKQLHYYPVIRLKKLKYNWDDVRTVLAKNNKLVKNFYYKIHLLLM